MGKRWIPLEANPDVMNQFMWGLGVTEGEVQFCDVYGLDDDLLAMVPQPVLAVIFLYPLTSQDDKVEEYDASTTSTAGGKIAERCAQLGREDAINSALARLSKF